MADEFMTGVMSAFKLGAKNASSDFCDVGRFLRTDDESAQDDYVIYGVDNEFDLLVAMYDEYSEFTGNLVRSPSFVERRICCAMNPDYTEKCLSSYAFSDVRDEILARLDNA